ncbi:MAG: ATP-binding protein [Burkholderiales bacterium]|nr:ATP-binding protein [Burkholderiales bacterium]
MKTEPAVDLDPLDLDARQASASSRRALLWLVGLLTLVTACIVLLALFLRDVEAQEEELRRAADAQWLEQTLRFHFQRLERDLAQLDSAQPAPGVQPPQLQRAGLLWRGEGVIAWQGWLAAERLDSPAQWPAIMAAAELQPEDSGTLAVMLDTGRGLQRPAYAGPLRGRQRPGDPLLWLAVPKFEQGRFLGNQVAAIRIERALEQIVPAWFLADHALLTLDDESGLTAPPGLRYPVAMPLPGAQWKLAVELLQARPAIAPRAFFGIALLCLVAMLVALYFFWRATLRRRQAERRLQTQIALRSAMERSVTLGLLARDLDGQCLYANPAFCRMLGWSARELAAKAGWPPALAASLDALPTAAAVTSGPSSGLELQLQHHDGHELELLVHGAPLTQADGRVMGWIYALLDITERKRVERLAARQQEQLEASGRLIAVGEVASTLAHELNQPLGALSSFASGLLNRVRQGNISWPEIVPVLERIERMAEKAGLVIQRINAFARRQEMSRQPLALAPFVRRVAQQLTLPPGVALQLELPEPAGSAEPGPSVSADALLLEHALHNLVLNATEWAGQGSSGPALVRVSLVQETYLTGIRIEDSGPGIPEAQRAGIFNAFASHKPGGMGMGLSICRSIVEAHHGRIEVGRSAALHGAQFTLWLPLTT